MSLFRRCGLALSSQAVYNLGSGRRSTNPRDVLVRELSLSLQATAHTIAKHPSQSTTTCSPPLVSTSECSNSLYHQVPSYSAISSPHKPHETLWFFCLFCCFVCVRLGW